MAERVVLHLGAHKTGTTALQEFFSSHLEEMSGGESDWIPLLTMRRSYTERLCGDEASIAGVREEIRAMPSRTVVLSDENIAGPLHQEKGAIYPDAGSRVGRLSDVLRHELTDIVFVVRNPARYLPSLYLEDMHFAPLVPFEQWLGAIDPYTISIHDLLAWRTSVPDHVRTHILSYEGRGGGFDDIVRDVAEVVGVERIDDEALRSSRSRTNTSISSGDLRAAHLLSRLAGPGAAHAFLAKYNRGPLAKARTRLRPFGTSRFAPFSEDEVAAMTARYRADLEALGIGGGKPV
jgi:hypothetical protein